MKEGAESIILSNGGRQDEGLNMTQSCVNHRICSVEGLKSSSTSRAIMKNAYAYAKRVPRVYNDELNVALTLLQPYVNLILRTRSFKRSKLRELIKEWLNHW